MPLVLLKIAPGVYTEATAKDAEPYYVDSNRIRFRRGHPESIGGWLPDSANTFIGVCRGINNWVTLSDDVLIGLGTHKRLYIWRGGVFTDITPLRDSTSAPFNSSQLNAAFSSTAASDLISVAHTGHGITTVGTGVVFSNVTNSPIDGTVIDGPFSVISITSANAFVIQIPAAVTTTEANWGGAAIDYDYEIDIGEINTVPALGWGADTWNASTWGTARATSTESILARTWALDQWGEDEIASIKGGAMYTWDATNGLSTRAIIITGAPSSARYTIVSPEARHLIGFGVNDGSVDDPLLIQWSTSEDFTDWDITSTTNSAGELRIDRGTEIVGAIRTRSQILVLTDVSAHSMFTTGDSLVFGIEILGEGCGLAGPEAATEHAGIVYYMGVDNFYIHDGLIRVLPCDVWTQVFEDINLDQKVKFHADTVVAHDEAWFFYCSANSDEIDKYVKYDWLDKIWDFGNLDRTAWVDIGQGGGLRTPYATDASGVLYQHETGVNDGASTALGSFIEAHDVELLSGGGEEGGFFYHIRKFLPDFRVLIGSVDIIFKAKRYHQSTPTEKTYTVTSSTERINPRVRGRQIAMRIESNDVDDEWSAGNQSIQIAIDGRR